MAGEQRFDHHVVGFVDARHRQQRGRDRLPIHALGFVRVHVDVAPAQDQVHRRVEMPQSRRRIAGHVGADKAPAVGVQCGGGTILVAVMRVAVRLFEQRLNVAPMRLARLDLCFIIPAAAIAARVL